MKLRELYLKKLINTKDTEFIKVVTGLRRSGKSSLMIMYKNYLLKNKIKESNIIYINFESGMYDDIKTYRDLYEYVKSKLNSKRSYIILDEVQNVEKWEKAINALNLDFDVDLYITGSNAYLLSSELSTLISGRYIEIKMYPLSFKEFIEFNKYTNKEDAFYEYLKFGGLPALSSINDNLELKLSYLNDIYNSIVKRDIIDRNSIKDVYLLEKIIKYVSSNIGSQISTTKISNYLNSNNIVDKCNPQTIESYLKMLENSFIMYKCDRHDIKSKEVLKTLGKYYISDIGIRNNLLGFRNIDEGHLLENIIYLELIKKGYKVHVGKVKEYEVDFIAQNVDEIIYVQVAQTIKNQEVFDREIRSLELINDNYPKIILTMDRNINKDVRGVKIINIIDFILD